MPRLPKQYLESESRSASIGIRNTFAGCQGFPVPVVKRTRRSRKTVGETYSKNFIQTAGSCTTTEFCPQPSKDLTSSDSELHTTSDMSDSSLGVNRLRSGFLTERNAHRRDPHSHTPSDAENSQRGLAMNDGVYDLTTEDDDGGVTLNINGEISDPIVISDDETSLNQRLRDNQSDTDTPITEGIEGLSTQVSQQEEGEWVDERAQASFEPMVVDSIKQSSTNTAIDDTAFVIDSSPATSQVCLKDLNPSQLEDQIRYAFWYLDRHQIDLSRLARCLNCQEDGHVDNQCPRKICLHCGVITNHESVQCSKAQRCERCRELGHEKSRCKGMKNTTVPCDVCSLPGHQEKACPLRHFPRVKDSSRSIKLWISCCICASRTHLVGDCPEALAEKAARWSLRSLDPGQITNLSVQANIQNMEHEAENRNMRPTSMKIKGRASIHHADANRRDQSDSDDQDFFGYSPAGRRPGREAYRSRPDIREARRDNFRPPARPDDYRPPRTGFYATDSFGQARSRSPGPFRHRDDRGRRSPSFDRSSVDSNYRPNRGHDTYRGNSSARPGQNVPQNRAQGSVSIQLPTRKGSNITAQNSTPNGRANLPAKPPQNTASNRTTASHDSLTRKQKKKQKKRNQS